jgi:hypothetical protein
MAECNVDCSLAGILFIQTTIIGLAGGAMNVDGAGRISGNGRYLLLTVGLRPVSSRILDLQTGQSQPVDPFATSSLSAGRVVADDGTIAAVSSGTLVIGKGTSLQTVSFPFPGNDGAEQAVIDSS